MQIVLDTCALIAFANGEPMQPAALRAIRAAQTLATAWVPSVTATEIARKVAAGRLQLGSGLSPRFWFAGVMRRRGFQEFPTSIEVAISAYELPEPFHKDPADRLIVATARLLDAPVVTVDRRILGYARLGHVATIAY
jgi:PIN domain nuclease of toxin-antitoxin system